MRRIKEHTLEKLKYFEKYIKAYLKATQKLSNKYYIDAFAGTGKCILCNKKCDSKGGIRCSDCGKGKIVDGSAIIALKINDKFDGYYFVELDKNNAENLEKFITEEVDKETQSRVKIKKSVDSNDFLKKFSEIISNNEHYKYYGHLIFLDPEGSELDWGTVKNLSKIKKIDLLILWAYDMGFVRLIKDYPEKIDKYYGSSSWRDIFDDKINNFTAEKRKTKMLELYIENLENLGLKHISCKQIKTKLRNGRNLYHLILASRNDKAKKIMEDVFNIELDGQQKMKF